MSRTLSPRRPRWRGLVAALSVAALLGAVAVPAQADPILIWDGSTAEFDLTVTTQPGSQDWLYRVDVTNLTAQSQHLGFGADLLNQGVTEYFWAEAWAPFNGSDVVLAPGESYSMGLLPAWSGMTYSFFKSIDTVPELIGDFVVAGRYLPFDLSTDVNGDVTTIQVGYPVTARPAVARAAESLRVEASLGAGWTLPTAEVWIGPNGQDSVQFESLFGRGLGANAISVDAPPILDGMTLLGSLTVTADAVAGNVMLPSGLQPGNYRILVGDQASGLWPAGPAIDVPGGAIVVASFVVEAGAPRGSTQPGTAVPVTPLDQFGTAPVSFTFDNVTAGGTTSVATSTTGPASTAFTLLGGANAVYYELSTTAGFSGQVTVCLSYDPTGLSQAQQDAIALFHYTGGAWSNITTTRAPGQVCGSTTSFSPFALGIPTLQYAFEGFLTPVSNTKINQEFAGSIIPIRFRLGGDQGLNVIAGGSPTTGVTACTVGALPATSQPAVSAITPVLTYVKATKTYWYFWKTDKSWAGSCRQFSLTLADGTVHTATVKFSKLTFGAVLRAVIRAI